MSMDRTERKKKICRKKSDSRATTATSANSCIAGEKVRNPHRRINIQVMNVLNILHPSLLMPTNIHTKSYKQIPNN